MSLFLIAACDMPGCASQAPVPGFARGDDWGGEYPTLGDNLPDPGRAMMVLDTSWIDLPEGWEFAVGDDDPHPIRCPRHRDRDPVP